MDKRSFQVVLTATLITAAFVSTVAAAPWIKFTSTPGRFSVLMPGPDEPEDNASTTAESTTSPQAAPYTTHLFKQVSENGVTFLVGWVDYAPAYRFDVQKELAANRDNFMSAFQGKIVSSRAITLGQNPGLEFIGERDDGTLIKSHIYVVGARPYMLIAVTPKGKDDAVNVQKFFASFQVR